MFFCRKEAMMQKGKNIAIGIVVGIFTAALCVYLWLPSKEERQDHLVEIPMKIPSGMLEEVDFDSMRNTPTVKITFDSFQQKNQEGAIGKVLYCVVDEPDQDRPRWFVYYFGFPTEFCGGVYQARIPWNCSTQYTGDHIFRNNYISGAALKIPDRLEVRLSYAETSSAFALLVISIVCGGISGLIVFGVISSYLPVPFWGKN